MPHKIIEVETNPSRMKAFVTVRPEEGLVSEGAQIWEELIAAELRASGVVFGIDRSALESLVKNRQWGEKVLVADGAVEKRGEALGLGGLQQAGRVEVSDQAARGRQGDGVPSGAKAKEQEIVGTVVHRHVGTPGC